MKLTTKFLIYAVVFWTVNVSTALLHAQTSDVPNAVLEQCEIDALRADAFDALRETAQNCDLDNAHLRGVIAAFEVRQDDYDRVFVQQGRLEAQVDRAQAQRWWFLGTGIVAGVLVTIGVLFAVTE